MGGKHKKSEIFWSLSTLVPVESETDDRAVVLRKYIEIISRYKGNKKRVNLNEVDPLYNNKNDTDTRHENLLCAYYARGSIYSFDLLVEEGASVYQKVSMWVHNEVRDSLEFKNGASGASAEALEAERSNYSCGEQSTIEYIISGALCKENRGIEPQKDYMIYSSIWHEAAKGEEFERAIKAEIERCFTARIDGNDLLNDLDMPETWRGNYAEIRSILERFNGEDLLSACGRKLEELERSIKGKEVECKDWSVAAAETHRLNQRDMSTYLWEEGSSLLSTISGGFLGGEDHGWLGASAKSSRDSLGSVTMRESYLGEDMESEANAERMSLLRQRPVVVGDSKESDSRNASAVSMIAAEKPESKKIQ